MARRNPHTFGWSLRLYSQQLHTPLRVSNWRSDLAPRLAADDFRQSFCRLLEGGANGTLA